MNYSGLLGRNIQYTLSPPIHNEYYKKNNIDLEYRIFDIQQSEVKKFLEALPNNNIVGVNVTIPYKEYIIDFLQELAYPANMIKAVNTVVINNNRLIGYNTDYFGFIESLKINNINLQGKKSLIIGSGGAAKAVLYGVKDLGVDEIHMVLRKKESIKDHSIYIDKFFSFEEELDLGDYDIVINCTPLGGANYIENCPIKIKNCNKNIVFYDLNYNPKVTKFMELGEKYGARTINGMDMLYSQAYKAIEIWKEIL